MIAEDFVFYLVGMLYLHYSKCKENNNNNIRIMMNKTMVLCIYFVTGLLSDVFFDISWLFSSQGHYIYHFMMAALSVNVVLAVVSFTFPSLSKLSYSLFIPSKFYDEKRTCSPGVLNIEDITWLCRNTKFLFVLKNISRVSTMNE